MSRVLKMLGVAAKDFTRNNCHYLAAGIAYWTLFSLFPLALAAISILGFLYPVTEQQSRIVEGVIGLIPVSEDYLGDLVKEVTEARGALGGLAIVGLLWTGTSVFSAVRKGTNHAWHIGKPHYFLKERAIDLVMMLGVAALAFIQVAFTTDLLGVGGLARAATESRPGVLLNVLLELTVLVATIGALGLLYRYVPNTEVTWPDVLMGAVMGGILFHGVKLGLTWYIGSFGSFNVVYGSLGAVMAVLVWAYLSSMAIVWGAQVSYTYAGVFGSRAGSIALPEARPKVPGPNRKGGALGMLAALFGWLLPAKKDRE